MSDRATTTACRARTLMITGVDAGASSLGSALQAAAGGVRELSAATTPKQTDRANRLITLAVTAIRKTCPALPCPLAASD